MSIGIFIFHIQCYSNMHMEKKNMFTVALNYVFV